jgi:hypothetical protein
LRQRPRDLAAAAGNLALRLRLAISRLRLAISRLRLAISRLRLAISPSTRRGRQR